MPGKEHDGDNAGSRRTRQPLRNSRWQNYEGNGGLPESKSLARLKARCILHGAQVTSWKPAGNDEILFLSTKSRWQEGQAIRGGIPICFPWFRAKADDPKAPAHGFVRTKSWQLESIVEEGNRSRREHVYRERRANSL
jgi:glucose-6-phosphate 1-epimerase